MRVRCRLAGMVLLTILVSSMFLRAASAVTTRESVDSSGVEGDNSSFIPSISSDGRYVAFYSSAGNLVAGDTNGVSDVFVRDRQTGVTTRVSVIDSSGNEANGDSYGGSISADGRYVAFYSAASDLVTGDTNGFYDVFVHDCQTGATTRVSVGSGGAPQGNGHSLAGSISADGRYVAFYSGASNLVAGDTNTKTDVFVHDCLSGATTRVSVPNGGAGQGDENSDTLSISADGRYVAFTSLATNLLGPGGDINGLGDVFVHDCLSGATTLVSVDSAGVQGNGESPKASISSDGRYVAFYSDASNLVGGDTNVTADVFVHDCLSGATTRVSVNSAGGQGNWSSREPSISPDGRYVAFYSDATNLVAGDTNGVSDVFVHDRQTLATTRVSADSSGVQGNNASDAVSITTDGVYVAFESLADNLVAGDTNGARDVFVAGSLPVADFAGTPASGPGPLTVNFTDLSTNSPTLWSWNFGDGGTSTSQNPSHTYTALGTYTVTLTATNLSGSNVISKANYITVTPCFAPVVEFTGAPTSGTEPLTVNFIDRSYYAPTSWRWDFGDGGTSNEQCPFHTYRAPGTYTVSLLAGNFCGSASKVKNQYITVTRVPPVLGNLAADPAEVPADGVSTTLLTVAATDSGSGITSVVIDLSSLGGSLSQPLYDDGTHGDAVAGDGVYSFRTTVSSSTTSGQKALHVIAADQAGGVGTGSIHLSVIEQISGIVSSGATTIHYFANQFPGQTLTIEYVLAPTRLRQSCATTLTVRQPDGTTHSTQEIKSQTTTLTIPNAEAGIWTYEVSTACSAPISYSITTSASGTGVITGTVTASGTQENLTGVEIRTNTGGIALSLSGCYVLVAPAGQCTVTVSGYGYKSSSQFGVTVIAGEEVAANLTVESLGAFYFPHVASNSTWETEIGIINPSATETVTGTLRPFRDDGSAASNTVPVTLAPHGRREITVGSTFSSPSTIGYMRFESNASLVEGYTKFFRPGLFRAAIPAAGEVNSNDIFLTHVTADPAWWTGVSLLNTSSQARTAGIEFSNGTSVDRNIGANEHQKFLVSDLFGGQTPTGISSAVVKNAPGVIGLELFGSANQLEGIPATDESTTTLYYPYVPTDPSWWAGIVAYNPSTTACMLTITGYLVSGTDEVPITRTLDGKQKLSALTSGLGLGSDTAWFKIEATSPITGFELIGTADWNRVGGFYGIRAKKKEGKFVKIERGGGWTYVSLANTEATGALVRLTAYDDSGTQVASTSFTLDGHVKAEQTAEQFFANQDISTATYLAYSSDKELVGLQLNGSADGTMLDGLPGL